MPQRPSFDFTSKTLLPILDTAGVLEARADSRAILGAYYDNDPEYSGLYVVGPSGVDYFDLNLEDIATEGLSESAYFNDGEGDYQIRRLVEEDGLWLSTCKIPLPLEVLVRIVISESNDTIEKLIGAELPEQLPTFESIYAYVDEKLSIVASLVYMSGYGIYSRVESNWELDDISLPAYQNLMTVEIDSEKANELLNFFDEKQGLLKISDLKGYEVEKVEE
jgi:hypothetical protein